MEKVLCRLIPLVLATLVIGQTQVRVFPLSEVRAGQRGVGKTVFAGGTVEEFQVEILGVLENIGPKQSIILARLSGGPMDRTGVMQGMSGSPVYIDGRLAGAVALAFPFATEPIAGIRPIEEMLRTAPALTPRADPRALLEAEGNLLAQLQTDRALNLAGESRLTEIATPVRFGGFTARTVETFAPQLRALGLEPRQGAGGGGSSELRYGDPSQVQPGSMISVQLIAGDLSLGADGTVTHVDGNRVYAFGHRFLSIGAAELPFARAEVMTLLPNLATSFKIASSHELMGTITADRNAAIAGELGRHATLVPVFIGVGAPSGPATYRLEMVRDRFLTPFLLQASLFSAIDAAASLLGPSTISVRGTVDFGSGLPELKIDNVYSSAVNTAVPASLSVAASLAYVLHSGHDELMPRGARIELDVRGETRELAVERLWASRATARPGETVEIHATLRGRDGALEAVRHSYQVPIGARTGTLYVAVSDSMPLNLSDLQAVLAQPARDARQVIESINRLRPNDRAWLTISRQEQSYPAGGVNLPAPPPSVALILRREQTASSPFATTTGPQSRLVEKGFPFPGTVVSGSRTLRIEVHE